MVAYRQDTTVLPTMIRLAAKLELEISKSHLPMPAVLGLVPGDAVVIDCGEDDKHPNCGGQAWVRLVNGFVTRDFPNPDSTGICSTAPAFSIEVGISRCVTVFADNKGNPPTVADGLRDTSLQLADMAAMRRAICATFAGTDVDYAIGQYLPFIAGGCGGGAWQVIAAQAAFGD